MSPRHSAWRRHRLTAALPLVASLVVVGESSTVGATLGPSPVSAQSGPVGGAQVVLNRMSEAQRVGQLFMVGNPATGISTSTLSAIASYHVGNVMLTGRSSAGVAGTRSITQGLQARASASATLGVPLFVGTDQEGGYVQVLSGADFSTIPQALTQGSWPTSTLRSAAAAWGAQLKAAGVGVNLAPVMDTVPTGEDNPPIGFYNREYGHSTSLVAAQGTAFSEGMASAGVAATIKHFPGLGRVNANTDTSSGVTDYVTTYRDPFLMPFHTAVSAGAPFAMMSTAYYAKIDPSSPAAFSTTIISGMLRGEMGFRGVIISDDLGTARQVAAWSPGARAVDFINAGGDMVLTVTPSVIPAMVDAVSSAAASSSAFRAKVDAAALKVLQAKQAQGLIRQPHVTSDFNGDGRSDIAVFRPSTGAWFVRGHPPVPYGQAGDVPVPGDYNGDGVTDMAVFRPSTGAWFVRGHPPVPYGRAGDVPVPGDYNGDGVTDMAVFRPSTGAWFVRGHPPVPYGRAGDVPVPGDYNGDGVTDMAVFRPSTGAWFVRGHPPVPYGQAGDVPVPGDYNGDGVTDIAIWRPASGVWMVRGQFTAQYGQAGDVPVKGFDVDGNGSADLTVFRPSSGTWFVKGLLGLQYGEPGDDPV